MDETVLALLAFSGTLALTLLVAFNVNNFFGKIFGAAANILSRYFTTSIEIHGHYGCSSNVTNWLKRLIEHNCGAKLGHFAIANGIISSKSRSDLSENESENTDEDDDSFDLRKHLEPLQNSQVIFSSEINSSVLII